MLPQRRRAVFQHVTPARERALIDDPERHVRAARIGQGMQHELGSEDARGQVARVRVLDVPHQHRQRAFLFRGGHQAQIESERLAGLRGRIIPARARLEELAVECGLDGLGQRLGFRGLGFLAQRPRDAWQPVSR